jgi:hypothetical protein
MGRLMLNVRHRVPVGKDGGIGRRLLLAPVPTALEATSSTRGVVDQQDRGER